MCVHVNISLLGEMHLVAPPQDESSWSENMCDHTQQHKEDSHWHHYHIVTNACTNVQPAAVVLHHEEKMQSHQVRDNQDNKEQTPWW